MNTGLLKKLQVRLGLGSLHDTADAALEVLDKITSGKGDVYTKWSGGMKILCYRPFGGSLEDLYLFHPEPKEKPKDTAFAEAVVYQAEKGHGWRSKTNILKDAQEVIKREVLRVASECTSTQVTCAKLLDLSAQSLNNMLQRCSGIYAPRKRS
jgi:hypothetical protein